MLSWSVVGVLYRMDADVEGCRGAVGGRGSGVKEWRSGERAFSGTN